MTPEKLRNRRRTRDQLAILKENERLRWEQVQRQGEAAKEAYAQELAFQAAIAACWLFPY